MGEDNRSGFHGRHRLHDSGVPSADRGTAGAPVKGAGPKGARAPTRWDARGAEAAMRAADGRVNSFRNVHRSPARSPIVK